MQEQAKVIWPDKSQFTADFKNRRAGNQTRHLPLPTGQRRFDPSIPAAAGGELRLERSRAGNSEAELRRQYQAQTAQFAAASAALASWQKMTPLAHTPEATIGAAADAGSPPWD
ncbi:hypothetical protein [Undibacterium sp.]|uniref:hypothetical protein n=1 Tax=Undibacterium sp. TaxID=1914977 RepID=UPI002C38A32C|nr:hypothetical protein [Undibacterium sp.]HTD02500.1 hypothetical protein [Undibacterium sp.]